MARVTRNTYASYTKISLEQYESVHGLIEEFGGRVKQFWQDPNPQYYFVWYIFFEMAKIQRPEFEQALKDLKNNENSKTV